MLVYVLTLGSTKWSGCISFLNLLFYKNRVTLIRSNEGFGWGRLFTHNSNIRDQFCDTSSPQAPKKWAVKKGDIWSLSVLCTRLVQWGYLCRCLCNGQIEHPTRLQLGRQCCSSLMALNVERTNSDQKDKWNSWMSLIHLKIFLNALY